MAFIQNSKNQESEGYRLILYTKQRYQSGRVIIECSPKKLLIG